jgi:hypothetical protein
MPKQPRGSIVCATLGLTARGSFMSLDELTEEVAPATAPNRLRWAITVIAGLVSISLTCLAMWTLGHNAGASDPRANHDALLESVTLMPTMWEQLQLPVDERSQAVIESGARLGSPTSEIEVTPELRVNEPHRIGVATTVRSDGITTVLVTIVRTDLGGNTAALGSGCDVGSTIEGMSCEEWVNEQFSTFTAPTG